MAHEGQELSGPSGMRLRFVRITDELLEMEAGYDGTQSLPPAHLHPDQDERFSILEGTVRAVIDVHEHRFAAGDVFDVPRGAVHQMAADGPARLRSQVRPPLRTGSARLGPGDGQV